MHDPLHPQKGIVMALKIPLRRIGVPAKPVVTTKVQAPAPSGFVAGDGFARARAINEQREIDRNRPFEFSMAVNEGGTNGVTLIITDTVRKPKLPYFHYMHRWGFEQKDVKTCVCIQDGPEGCPVCRSLNKKGSYEMVLSVIDTRPYTPQKGPNKGKTIPRQKRPYIAKSSMIPVFERLYNSHNTYRGMVIRCFRDNAKAPSGGSQVEFVRMLSEAELLKYGKDLITPFDYAKVYPRLAAAKLASLYGGDAAGAVGDSEFSSTASEDDALPF